MHLRSSFRGRFESLIRMQAEQPHRESYLGH
jgi:hypothetical protein